MPKQSSKLKKIKYQGVVELRKQCDNLWYEIIKKRAGYKSELSGQHGKQIGGDSILNAHHIMAKPNFRLRYELQNGICLTQGEHKWGVHNPNKAEEYRDKIIAYIGQERWDFLKSLKSSGGKPSIYLTKLYLENELAKLSDLREGY